MTCEVRATFYVYIYIYIYIYTHTHIYGIWKCQNIIACKQLYLKYLSNVWLSPNSLTVYFYCRCSVAQSCPTFCDPTDCSTPGFPVLSYLPEFAQIRVHWFYFTRLENTDYNYNTCSNFIPCLLWRRFKATEIICFLTRKHFRSQIRLKLSSKIFVIFLPIRQNPWLFRKYQTYFLFMLIGVCLCP